MKVAFLLRHFPPFALGATYSALNLAAGLRNLGVEVEFVVEDIDGRWREGGVYQDFSVRGFYLDQPSKFKTALGIIACLGHLRRGRFDLIHIHGGSHRNLLYSWLFPLLSGIPAILKITMDGWDSPDGVLKQRWGRLNLFFYRRLSGIVAMTSGQFARLRRWNFRGATAIIPNGVDTNRFKPDRQAREVFRSKMGIAADAFVLFFAGKLDERKGLDVLLDIYRQLKTKHPNVVLLLAGDYGSKGKLEKLMNFTEQRGMSLSAGEWGGVVTVGQVDDIEQCFQSSDVFVFPSRQEGFGTVQVEALACGLPCAVNDLADISSDIYPDSSIGCRVLRNDISTYLQVISGWIDHPESLVELKKKARVRAVEYFSIESVSNRYFQFYQDILVKRGAL
jgi:glycosyltransferase involved in cell wall biosynthesis